MTTPRLTHLDAAGHARMVDVGAKPVTARSAEASGRVLVSAEVLALLRGGGGVPKGDALAVARLAGLQAAKRTPDLVPLAHPVAVHGVEVEVTPDDRGVLLHATVRTADRTGIEMEALTCVAVAGLALIDMVKAVDRHAVLTDVQVVAKSGGRSGDWRLAPADAAVPVAAPVADPAPAAVPATVTAPVPADGTAGVRQGPRRAQVVVASTRAAAGAYADRSGPVLAEGLRGLGFAVAPVRVVADGPAVGEALRAALAEGPDLVVTSGGTGLAPSDRTPEQTLPLLDATVPGLAEAVRARGVAAGVPAAVLSRGVAGVAGRTLVVNVAGSTGAARDAVAVLGEVLGHAVDQLRGGGDHDAGA